MNAPYHGYQEDQSIDYQVDYGRNQTGKVKTSRRPQYTRGGARPAAFNGLHRRRNKRIGW